MRFEVQYSYLARYREYRRKKCASAQILADTQIDIDEVDDPGEPAFVIEQALLERRHYSSGWQRFRSVDGRPGRVWLVGDRYFAEYCPVEVFADQLRKIWDNPFNADNGAGSASTAISDRQYDTYESIAAHRVLKLWEDDGGVAQADLIAERSRAMRVIAGMICVAVSEPVVDVDETYKNIEMRIVEIFPDGSDGFYVDPERWHGRVYRIENIQEAKAFARELSASTGKPLNAQVDASGTSCCGLPQQGQHLNWSTERLIDDYRNMVGPATESEQSAWMDLELAFELCPMHHATPVLANAAEQFLLQLSVGRTESLGVVLTIFRDDLRRWRERPLDEDDRSHEALPIASARFPITVQILSTYALKVRALDLCIPVSKLLDLRGEGLMLFDHRVWEWDGEREVSRNLIIAVDSDLKITNILSRYGVQLPFAKSVRFQEFLDRNAAEIDLVALGELEPIDFAPHSLVP